MGNLWSRCTSDVRLDVPTYDYVSVVENDKSVCVVVEALLLSEKLKAWECYLKSEGVVMSHGSADWISIPKCSKIFCQYLAYASVSGARTTPFEEPTLMAQSHLRVYAGIDQGSRRVVQLHNFIDCMEWIMCEEALKGTSRISREYIKNLGLYMKKYNYIV